MKLPNLLDKPKSEVKTVDSVFVYGVGCVTDDKSKALSLPLTVNGKLVQYNFDKHRVVNI